LAGGALLSHPGCSDGEASPPAAASGGSIPHIPEGGRDTSMPDLDASAGGGVGGAPSDHPLCGTGECDLDDRASCDGGASGASGAADGGASGAIGEAGMGGETGDGGNSGLGGASGQAGVGGQAGDATGAGGAGGASQGAAGVGAAGAPLDGGAPETPARTLACRLSRSDDQLVRNCEAAGEGDVDAPCVSSADCAPGLGCVGQGQAARCRPFCCGGSEACEAGTYCTERALHEEGEDEAEPLIVPVCVKADRCMLSEPYPCPSGTECVCGEGTACAVVRSDGTTSCTEPGTGAAGQPCPCAWGHVCSQASRQCLKLCTTGSGNGECGSGRCQAAANLPEGWGVCVGAAQADAG
jgi:hypothetical protein